MQKDKNKRKCIALRNSKKTLKEDPLSWGTNDDTKNLIVQEEEYSLLSKIEDHLWLA